MIAIIKRIIKSFSKRSIYFLKLLFEMT